MRYFKFTLLILGCILFTAFSYKAIINYGKPNSLEIKGYVYFGEEQVENALVKLYQENNIVQKLKTKKTGKFAFLLFNDIDYTIEVEKQGFITERIKVSTKSETEKGGKYFYEFRVHLNEASKLKGVDISNLDFPTAIIKYDPKLDKYAHDKVYAKEVKAELKRLKAEAKNARY